MCCHTQQKMVFLVSAISEVVLHVTWEYLKPSPGCSVNEQSRYAGFSTKAVNVSVPNFPG